MIAHLDGQPVSAPLAGLWSARGVYETFLWHGQLPKRWSFHVERCRRGAQAWRLPLPTEAALADAVRAVAVMHPGEPLRMRLTLFENLQAKDGSSLLVEARPLSAAERDPAPARVVLGGDIRNPASLLAGCKRLGIAEDLAWRDRARAMGADDVLLCSTSGLIAEASTASLLCGLQDGRIATPGPEAAPVWGTTLAQVREAIPAIVELPLGKEDVVQVRWALLLNAVCGARAVSHIEDRELAQPPEDLLRLAKALTGSDR